MSLAGGDSYGAMMHDLVESLQHKMDKLVLGQRKQFDYLIIPKDRSLDFKNDFPDLARSGVYLRAPAPVPVFQQGVPEEWDKDGTIASFSAGSEVAELRRFLLTAEDEQGRKRKRRGRPRTKDGEKDALPPPPPDMPAGRSDPLALEVVGSDEYLKTLLKARAVSKEYHRWSTGEGGRPYWKGCPVTTRRVEGDDVGVDEFLEPLARAFELARNQNEEGLRRLVEAVKAKEVSSGETKSKRAVKGTSDLRRYTINAAPALARAMTLMLQEADENKKSQAQTKVRELMVSAAQPVAAEFERVTGRKVVGVSIHFDSNLPHWNIWHSGLEPVIYKVGKSERTRFRRTAMDLNASGNMLAWDRSARAFERVGERFSAVSPTTAEQLLKAERRAFERQNRPPGDFTLNRKADEVLEEAIKAAGFSELVDRGYREFVENEKKRFAAGLAGRDPGEMKNLIDLLKPEAGEMPLDAARRLVRERQEVESAVVAVAPERAGVVAMVEGITNELSAARTVIRKMRGHLHPNRDEDLVGAASRLMESAQSLQHGLSREQERAKTLENELLASRKKADDLEREIGPLRQLSKLMKTILNEFMNLRITLPPAISRLLKTAAELVKVEFKLPPTKEKESGRGMQ